MMIHYAQRWHQALSAAQKLLLWGIIGFIGFACGLAMNMAPESIGVKPASAKTEASDIIKKLEYSLETVPFEKITKYDDTIAKGTTKITTPGVNGERMITHNVTYKDGFITNREILKSAITKKPIDEVTSIGTRLAQTVSPTPKPSPKVSNQAANCDPNYTPCVQISNIDLDCADIGFQVHVIGTDVHHLDRDHDGYGCESF